MEEETNDIVSSLDEKDEEESEEQRRKSGLATHAHLLMRVTLQLIHCLISLSTYRWMIAMISAMTPLIHLKYPFLTKLMLAMLVAKMPI